jgi:hypothetical protein
MTTACVAGPPHAVLPEGELRRLEDDLASLSARLDAVVDDPALGTGLAAMGLDQASQAIHLALIAVRDCIGASSSTRRLAAGA